MHRKLQGETIIYFGPEPWAGLWRNRHQLMSRFAQDNDVWYVEPPTMLRQLISGKQNKSRNINKPRGRLLTRDPSGVTVFHSPWWIPITGRAPLKGISIWLYLAVLSVVARLRDHRRPIVWFSRPGMTDFVGKLKAKLTIYHVVDEYSGYGSASRKQPGHRVGREDEMLRSVDAVIVVTPTLFDLKSPHNPNTHLVPNAVDFSAYSNCDAPVPDDMTAIPGPVIGYSGLIAARLDLELLRAAAEARPDWSYVFVGSVNDDRCQAPMKKLRDLPNVYFPGEKSASAVPRYVQAFDVCMIPYALDLRARHASPLKLYEYAAASKPIVATDFPAASSFEGHIDIVHDEKEFLSACERILKGASSAAEVRDNREFAAKNTWRHRIELISEIIRNSIAGNT